MNLVSRLFLMSLFCFASLTHIEGSEISAKGFWVGEDVQNQHAFDPKLAMALTDFFKKEKANTLVDFGCGLGNYVSVFKLAQFDVQGFDGNPATPTLTSNECGVIDLSVPFNLNKQYDWVMSLEVGEHLPATYETTFMENLIKHAKNGIVLSWAVKGQGGYGHFNEQSNEYIKKKFANYGFTNDVAAENALREKSTLWWFKNTIMVFRKKTDKDVAQKT